MSKTLKMSNGDFYVDSAGRFSYIGDGVEDSSGREKVAQDSANTLLQKYNPVIPWGSYLSETDSGNVVLGTSEHHRLWIQNEVTDALERLRLLQEFDSYVTSDEKIDSISVVVMESPEDLKYFYYVSIKTEASNEPITKAFSIDLEHVKDPNYTTSEILNLLES